MNAESNLETDLTDIFLKKYKNKKYAEKGKYTNEEKIKNFTDKNKDSKSKSKVTKVPTKIPTKTHKTRSKKHKCKIGPMGPMGPRGASNLTEIFVNASTYSLPYPTNNQVLEIIKTSSSTWSGFNNFGLDGFVTCIVEFQSVLYVGGNFRKTADGSVTNLNNIAKYDPNASNGKGQWYPLANDGLNGVVNCIHILNNVLYVGGEFNATSDNSLTTLNHIAKYDPNANSGNGQWYALAHDGLNNIVNSIINVNDILYVGGKFDKSSDQSVSNLNCVAKYDTTNSGSWSTTNCQLDSDNDYVNTLCYDSVNTLLYAGGEFSVNGSYNIIKYNGTAWSSLANGGLYGQVICIALSSGNLFVGGYFSKTYDPPIQLNHIARYYNESWHSLANNGLNNIVRTIVPVANSNTIWIGGDFSSTYDYSTLINLNLIAKYNTNDDSWVSPANQGILNETGGGSYSNVRAVLPISNIVYIGGEIIHKTADLLFKNFNDIVQYNTSNVLTVNYNNTPLTTLGLFGESVKLFSNNGTWNIIL